MSFQQSFGEFCTITHENRNVFAIHSLIPSILGMSAVHTSGTRNLGINVIRTEKVNEVLLFTKRHIFSGSFYLVHF